jgi:predicted transcriptional regulator
VFFLVKNRDKLSLVAAVLEAASSGSRKTRIMFAANLSFKLLEKYLETAIGAGFLQVNGSNYVLTESGREYLTKYRSFNEKYSKVQDALGNLAHERDQLAQLCEKSLLPDATDSVRFK